MAQVTLYLPDTLETEARRRAAAAGKSLSGYLTTLLARDVAPREWSPALLSVLDEGAGDIEVPEDLPAEDAGVLW